MTKVWETFHLEFLLLSWTFLVLGVHWVFWLFGLASYPSLCKCLLIFASRLCSLLFSDRSKKRCYSFTSLRFLLVLGRRSNFEPYYLLGQKLRVLHWTVWGRIPWQVAPSWLLQVPWGQWTQQFWLVNAQLPEQCCHTRLLHTKRGWTHTWDQE